VLPGEPGRETCWTVCCVCMERRCVALVGGGEGWASSPKPVPASSLPRTDGADAAAHKIFPWLRACRAHQVPASPSTSQRRARASAGVHAGVGHACYPSPDSPCRVPGAPGLKPHHRLLPFSTPRAFPTTSQLLVLALTADDSSLCFLIQSQKPQPPSNLCSSSATRLVALQSFPPAPSAPSPCSCPSSTHRRPDSQLVFSPIAITKAQPLSSSPTPEWPLRWNGPTSSASPVTDRLLRAAPTALRLAGWPTWRKLVPQTLKRLPTCRLRHLPHRLHNTAFTFHQPSTLPP
jgi:hypothetical protein